MKWGHLVCSFCCLVLATVAVGGSATDLPSACSKLASRYGDNFVDFVKSSGKTAAATCHRLERCSKDVDLQSEAGLMRMQSTGVKLAAPIHSILCPNDCSGNGICDTGNCLCQPGYGGLDCSIDECDHLDKCNGRGWCRNSKCLCNPGFSGPKCQTVALCPKNCSSHGVCKNSKCFCDPGFSGDDCSKKAQCPNGCSNNGVCVRGKCLCTPGYGLADCSLAVAVKPCPKGCSGSGVCRLGKCYCDPGFDGPDCATTLKCLANCNGRGLCPYGKRCLCDPGYNGDGCSTPKPCPNDCNNKGTCRYGQCFCDPGFSGPDCRHEAKCPSDCSGHGMCITGRCYCSAAFTGEDCSLSLREARIAERAKSCPKQCHGRGVCSAGMRLKSGVALGNCLCEPGSSGLACEVPKPCPVDNATAAATGGKDGPCSGRGLCIAGTCYCQRGFSGPACAVAEFDALSSCLANCSGHGTCMAGTCYCQPGFTGATCSRVAQCTPADCNGHGTCSRGKCFCQPGFTGLSCETAQPCPNDCSSHGVCVRGKCMCEPSYAGPDCSQAPSCALNPCQHGICRGGRCLCADGFTGPSCAVPTPPLADTVGAGRPHCLHDCVHGTCSLLPALILDGPGSGTVKHMVFTCKCDSGWTGAQCDAPRFSLQHKCNADTCVHGNCTPPTAAEAAASGGSTALLCRCDSGYSGTFCDSVSGTGDGLGPAYGKADTGAADPASLAVGSVNPGPSCVQLTAEEKKAWGKYRGSSQGSQDKGLPTPATNLKPATTNPTTSATTTAATKTITATTTTTKSATTATTTTAQPTSTTTTPTTPTTTTSSSSSSSSNPLTQATSVDVASAKKAVGLNFRQTRAITVGVACSLHCTADVGSCVSGRCVCHPGVTNALCMPGVTLLTEAPPRVHGPRAVVGNTHVASLASTWTGGALLLIAVAAFGGGLFVGFVIKHVTDRRASARARNIMGSNSNTNLPYAGLH